MSCLIIGRTAVFLVVLLTGCGIVGARKDVPRPATAAADRLVNPARELALAGSAREPPLADPSTMIPPPPRMDLMPDIPAAPPKDDQFVNIATPLSEKSSTLPASGVLSPDNALAMANARERAAPVGAEPNLDALKRIHQRASERFASLEGFECQVTRRETVNGRPMPEEVLHYRFRKDPYSVHIKWIGLEGQGRELIYVAGKHDGKVQILTGRDEGLLIPSGKRVSYAPTDSTIRSKSRYDIREGGMALSIARFGKAVTMIENDQTHPNRVRYLGVKPRRERESGLEAVEEIIPPNWEHLFPRGGKRTMYFDSDPASPSFGLPILLIALAETGREVEYYWFDQLKLTRPTDADFDADRLWRK
jgi:Protein of unknown function (DUF1571)